MTTSIYSPLTLSLGDDQNYIVALLLISVGVIGICGIFAVRRVLQFVIRLGTDMR
jgi:hypothetical protein